MDLEVPTEAMLAMTDIMYESCRVVMTEAVHFAQAGKKRGAGPMNVAKVSPTRVRQHPSHAGSF